MPKQTERLKTIQFVDHILKLHIVSLSTYFPEDNEYKEIEKEVVNILNLKAMVLSCRFFSPSESIPKSSGYRELLWLLPANEFKQELRMHKESFLFIKSRLEEHWIFYNQSNNSQEDVSIQLAVTLEKLGNFGNGCSVGKIARAKGIGNGTVCKYYSRCIVAILDHLAPNFLKWPNAEERIETSTRIFKKYGVPNVVGFIDGTHIILSQRPALDGEVYFNRKKTYSMNVILICDDRRRILWMQTGWPGSVYDATVFSHSNLFNEPLSYHKSSEFLIGDSGFILGPNMVIPYTSTNAQLPDNIKFNEHISKMRVVIEHVNGILKNRWSSLKGIRTQLKNKEELVIICDHIKACCVLHNVLLSFLDDWAVEEELSEDDSTTHNASSPSGTLLRETIKQLIINNL